MNKATVTIEVNTLFQPWESTILEQLRLIMPQYTILSVERALFSGRFTVLIDTRGASHEKVTHDFLRAMQDMNYNGEVVAVDSGDVSSVPGGLVQATTETLTQTTEAASGFLIPAAVIAVVIFAVIYLPKPRS